MRELSRGGSCYFQWQPSFPLSKGNCIVNKPVDMPQGINYVQHT
jgi:hypothetical protein